MSKTARTDGQWQVDCDLNGVPICTGQPLSLPRYDLPTLDEVRAKLGPWGAADVVGAVKSEHPNVTGHRVIGQALLMILARKVESAERKPCRCGPDGCADSRCPGRGER